MKRYQVEFTETLQRVVEVEADNELEAYKLAKKMYKDCVLSWTQMILWE